MTAHPSGLGSMTRDELEAWVAANPAEAQTYVALHAQYRKQLAATDPNTFAEWVAVDEGTGEPIRQAPHHETMHRLVSEHPLLVLWAHVESGKALPLDTPIPTPSGAFVAMGDLKPGDVVFGGDGRPVHVTATSPVFVGRKVYEMVFDDGATLRADGEHLWAAWTQDDRVAKRAPRVVTTEEMRTRLWRVGGAGPIANWTIPVAGPAEYPERALPIHPYVLGTWLGDGHSAAARITLHIDDREVWDTCNRLEPSTAPLRVRDHIITSSLGSVRGKGRSMRARLVALGVLNDKHIPEAYLRGSVEQRRALLAGLMDTDGTAAGSGTKRGSVSFTNTNERLFRDFVHLVRGLGIKVRVTSRPANLRGVAYGTAWLATFCPDVPVFWLARKRAKHVVTGGTARSTQRRVLAINPVESVPTRCIVVDSPEHTFLAGRDFTVTHNSTQLTAIRTVYELGRNPNLRVAVVSNTQEQAVKLATPIRRLIEDDSGRVRDVFPSLRRSRKRWTDASFTVERSRPSKDPSVQCFGVHGAVLGARIDLLVLDDILDFENTRTPEGRKALLQWVRSTLFGRLTKRAKVIVLGTAWHPEDLLHTLAKEPGWHSARFSVQDEATGLPTWPEVWPLDRIRAAITRLGPLEAARQLFCRARSDEDARFKQEWIDACLKRGEGRVMPYRLARVPLGYRVVTGVDLGTREKRARGKQADTTTLFTLCVHPNEDREVLCVERGRWHAPEIVRRIKDTHARYGSTVYVESNACFVPGTRVLTPSGYVPIERVQPGDLVWTHRGRWRPVTATLTGRSRVLVDAKAKGALPVRCTPNHWFYMQQAGRTPGRGGGHHRPVGAPTWVSYGARDESAYAALAVPRWPDIAPALHLPATLRDEARDVAVNERLALVLGLFMAEGHTTARQVFWTLGAQEGYLAEFIAQTIRGIVRGRVSVFTRGSVIRVVVSSTQLAQALKVGTGAAKTLPMAWMGWPLALRFAVVRGWLLGDGSVQATKAGVWSVHGGTVSRDWAAWVRATLAHAGLRPTMAVSSRTGSVIEGRTVTRSPMFTITLPWGDARALRDHMGSTVEGVRWARWFREDTRTPSRAFAHVAHHQEGHLWSLVPDLENQPYQDADTPVHNLVVAEDESYTVEDFIVHNAQDFIRQFIVGESALPILPFNTGANKANPEFGVESLAVELFNAKWIIPSAGGRSTLPVEQWIGEMLAYTPGAHTGDALMASWFAREGARSAPVEPGSVETGRIDLHTR